MRRLKEHKRQEKLAKRRETKLKNQYQALLKLQADHPEKALAIKAYFLPFYQTALINSAKKSIRQGFINISQCRKSQAALIMILPI